MDKIIYKILKSIDMAFENKNFNNDETFIKQLVIDKQGIIRLKSFNPTYDDIIVLNPALLKCEGRVIVTFTETNW